MKLSLSNGIFSKLSLTKNFASIQQLGFQNIEFNMKTVKKENDTAVYVAKELLDQSGLNCLTLHSAVLHVKDPVEVHRAVYYGKISLEFAQKMRVPIMTVHSNISKMLPKPIRESCLAEIFSGLNDYANKHRVKLALENLSYTSTGFGKNVEQLEEVLGIIDDGRMGITFDFCHALETKQTKNLLEKYGRRVCNVHMADKAHKPFMKETPELTEFLETLQGYGYEGPITLEIKHSTPIEEIAKTKALFENLLKKH
ncbi:MAG: sugar phosphate isomerase/epimerase [Candidatus Bathyarchaeota archaeon]|nr:sugar phosphate isomerase/epimerase [Candidatus Bathyarchaeota archaeon]